MRKRWTSVIVLLTMLQWTHLYGQTPENMVYNPSFEEYSICPQRIDAIGIMEGVDAWWQPTRGSSDYFNPCGGRECLTPRNKMGNQPPHSGEAYCGIYCSKENYREYLQTELKEPLVAGRKYHVSYWVSLAEKSPYAVATLGALFTTDRVTDTTWRILMNREVLSLEGNQQQVIATYYKPQVMSSRDSLLASMTEWQQVSGDFVAKGGEKYLTIGNFNSFNHSNVHDIGNSNAILQGAYYYIDDVSVTCLDCGEQPAPIVVVDTPKKGDVVEMEGVLFEVDKSDLLPQSYNVLRRLIEYLEANPSVKIELRGHTDNQGTLEHNRRLSENRAKAVMEYLVAHGIDRRRLSWKGFGKSRPVDTNDTPEGRQHNRRVEYLINEE